MPATEELIIPVPRQGLWDGLDPQSPGYPDDAAPTLKNLRVLFGQWETRKGMTLWTTLSGSGSVRMLANYYPVSGTDAGHRIRVAVRGATVYDFDETAPDVAWQSTSGSATIAGSDLIHFTALRDRLYFVAGSGSLWRYESVPATGNQVRAVSLPTAPAAGPRVISRPYWTWIDLTSGIGSFSESSNGNFDVANSTATEPSPMPAGGSMGLTLTTTSAKGKRIQGLFNDPFGPQMAFYFKTAFAKNLVNAEVGTDQLGQVSVPMVPFLTDAWTPMFVDLDGFSPDNGGYVSFKCVHVGSSTVGTTIYVSTIVSPGKLDGKYRYRYTHYDPTTGRESPVSPISNGGFYVNCSAASEGVQNSPTGINRSAILIPTTDSGTDATTTRFRIYRNGGVPSLIKDNRGNDVWYRVATIVDATVLTDVAGGGAGNIGDLSVKVATNPSTAGFAVGQWAVVGRNIIGGEDFVKISALTATHIQFNLTALKYAHAAGETVQVIFNDNIGNEEIDTTTPIDIYRADPPQDAKWIARSPDGRLWAANYSGKRNGIAVSNRVTPDRPDDHEVFPTGVDPLTSRDPNQGWRFQLSADNTDEEIEWLGFFQDRCHVFTRHRLYVIEARSQLDWGPFAINPVMDIGCIRGDTVQEIDNELFWVAEGETPRVMRWDGRSAPKDISFQRISGALGASPNAYRATSWFARMHTRRDGRYYLLWVVPASGTTCTIRYDYHTQADSWDSFDAYSGAGTALAWQNALVKNVGSDSHDLYAADSSANLFQMETGSLDNTQPIRISFSTKKFFLRDTSLLWETYLYLAGVDDDLTLTVAVFGSEYGDVSHSYTLDLNQSGTPAQIPQRLHRNLQGRWVQLSATGSVSNRPALEAIRLWFQPFRPRRIAGTAG